MRRVKKLSEILEECIEAGLAGRRSLEASLALYPAQAEELEPLLRTALSVSDSFQSYAPPAAVEQRIRSRFLADAAARRNLRRLEGSFEKRGWLSGLFRKPVFGGFAAAAAVAVAVLAITVGGVNLSGSNEGGTAVINPSSSAVVVNLSNQVDSIYDRLENGGQIQSADLTAISALLDQLASATPKELQESAAELEAILPGMLEIFTSSDGTPGTAADQAVIAAIDTATRDIANVLGFDVPDPVVVGAATPAPTDAAVEPTEPPVEPTDVPTEPTPAPTGGATVAPTATPPPSPPSTPTATTDDRAPPGFSP